MDNYNGEEWGIALGPFYLADARLLAAESWRPIIIELNGLRNHVSSSKHDIMT